ncbi:hypothetical protein RND71_025484 [Anisodus tanguticus]|uniref:Vacuolar ATPase assembly integral membrane protein VMA21 homolog n=1 Tax=Anisodus tanguticus TaxID=243964 RepID=A0AAE1V4W2_9SOLA|nr:hypothetical protein RND71_025484 [Anisodus tanguticus]
MAGVVNKFFITSMIMWAAPIAILYAFNHNLIPGTYDGYVTSSPPGAAKCGCAELLGYISGVTEMSPHSMTLVSGFVAVISVNVVIAFYICLAMREPSDKHEPDPKFLAEAKASVKQLGQNQDGDSSDIRAKKE